MDTLEPVSPSECPDQRVAVVIPAKDEAARVAATVRACRAIPRVDLVVVVDDGSIDSTQDHARAAGAVTVRHSVTRGKASALETGAGVVAMRDYKDGPTRLLLFIDADLGDSAASCADLVPPVVDGVADMSIAAPPKQAGAGGRGRVVRAARAAIAAATFVFFRSLYCPFKIVSFIINGIVDDEVGGHACAQGRDAGAGLAGAGHDAQSARDACLSSLSTGGRIPILNQRISQFYRIWGSIEFGGSQPLYYPLLLCIIIFCKGRLAQW